MKRYSPEQLENLIDETVKKIHLLTSLKGGEYSGDIDRLANFRRNAENLELTMEDVWAIYAAKHWDAINQYVKDVRTKTSRLRLESISSRADDLIVYLILLKAIINDHTSV